MTLRQAPRRRHGSARTLRYAPTPLAPAQPSGGTCRCQRARRGRRRADVARSWPRASRRELATDTGRAQTANPRTTPRTPAAPGAAVVCELGAAIVPGTRPPVARAASAPGEVRVRRPRHGPRSLGAEPPARRQRDTPSASPRPRGQRRDREADRAGERRSAATDRSSDFFDIYNIFSAYPYANVPFITLGLAPTCTQHAVHMPHRTSPAALVADSTLPGDCAGQTLKARRDAVPRAQDTPTRHRARHCTRARACGRACRTAAEDVAAPYSVSPIGKTGLPVSDSWISMPVMPIMAARPLLRSTLSFHVRPRKSSSLPTCFVEPSPSHTS